MLSASKRDSEDINFMAVVVAFSHASMLRLDGSDPQGLKLKHAPLFLSAAVILMKQQKCIVIPLTS